MTNDTARPGDIVLVVEDDVPYRELLRQQLEAEGYRVVEAGDGVEALEVLNTTSVTAMVADLKMPRLDGHGLCRMVRADDRFRHLPVMVLSGMDDPDDLNDLIELGGIRYLRKGSGGHGVLRSLRLLIESSAAVVPVH